MDAVNAMPHGGRLVIETADADVNAAFPARCVGMEPAAYVRLGVSDSGHGMDAETRSRIFEPFFTNKEQGTGIGLGLATVHGVVNQASSRVTRTPWRGPPPEAC